MMRKSRAGQRRQLTMRTMFSSGDPVALQFSIKIRKPKNVKITRALLREMVIHKARTSEGYYDPKSRSVIGAKEGQNPSGVEIKLVRWRNPDRKAGPNSKWNSHGTQAEAWGSLRHAIEGARITFN